MRPTTEHFEKANLCPVASLNLALQETEVSLGKTGDGRNAWVLTDSVEAVIEPRFNPLAVFVRARSNITHIGVIERATTIVPIDDVATLPDQLNTQTLKDRVFSEILYQQLGSNCLACVLSKYCPAREKLAAQAHTPSLRYE